MAETLEFSLRFSIPRSMMDLHPRTQATVDWLATHEAEYRATLEPVFRGALNQAVPVDRPPVILAAQIQRALANRWPEHEIAVEALPNETY